MTKISTHLYPSPIAVPADARDMLDLRSSGITAPLFAVTYTHSVPACWTDFLAGWRVCGQLTHSGGLAGVMRSILVPRCKGTAYTLAVVPRPRSRPSMRGTWNPLGGIAAARRNRLKGRKGGRSCAAA